MKISEAVKAFQEACVVFGYAQGMGLSKGDGQYDAAEKVVKNTHKLLVDAIARRLNIDPPQERDTDTLPCIKMFKDY